MLYANRYSHYAYMANPICIVLTVLRNTLAQERPKLVKQTLERQIKTKEQLKRRFTATPSKELEIRRLSTGSNAISNAIDNSALAMAQSRGKSRALVTSRAVVVTHALLIRFPRRDSRSVQVSSQSEHFRITDNQQSEREHRTPKHTRPCRTANTNQCTATTRQTTHS